MTANVNPKTQIPYGYISANALHPDVMDDLQRDGTDVYYDDAKREEFKHVAANFTEQGGDLNDVREWLGMHYRKDYDSLDETEQLEWRERYVEASWDGSGWEQEFNDRYQPDEPVHEGIKDGVKYRTSWLGGALNVWVFDSPHVTETAVACSPCVPGAGNLDQVGEGSYQCYDVPWDWLDEEAAFRRADTVAEGYSNEELAAALSRDSSLLCDETDCPDRETLTSIRANMIEAAERLRGPA